MNTTKRRRNAVSFSCAPTKDYGENPMKFEGKLLERLRVFLLNPIKGPFRKKDHL